MAAPARPRRARGRDRGPVAGARTRRRPRAVDVGAIAWRCSPTNRSPSPTRSSTARAAGATDEELGRALAYAAALRIVRFHTRNDHADWDTVHHSFTAAERVAPGACGATPLPSCGAPRCTPRCASISTASSTCPRRGCRTATIGSIDGLNRCFDAQGMVDEAANEAYGFLQAGGARAELIAALGRALLVEDAGFHWFQTVEAGVRQATAWPEGSEESALILVASPASSPPTRRPGASCRRSCASRRGCAAAKRSTKTTTSRCSARPVPG